MKWQSNRLEMFPFNDNSNYPNYDWVIGVIDKQKHMEGKRETHGFWRSSVEFSRVIFVICYEDFAVSFQQILR